MKDIKRNLTDEDRSYIVGRLQAASSGLYECQDFATIEEFVKYATNPVLDIAEIVNRAILEEK